MYNIGENVEWKFMMKVKGLNEKLGNKFVFDAFVIDEKTGINFPIKIQEGIQFV